MTESAEVSDDAYVDGKRAQKAVELLAELAKQPDQPFFLAVGMTKPHLPFVAPKKYWDLYNRNDFKMPQKYWYSTRISSPCGQSTCIGNE